MASKLWGSLCLVLFAYNLIELIGDRHLLNYKIVEEGDTFYDQVSDLNYLACTPFSMLKSEDLLSDKPPNRNVSAKSFFNRSIASIKDRLNVTGPFRPNKSYIFNDHVCFPTTKFDLENEGKPFNEFLRLYGWFNIFIYSKEKQPNFYERAYEKNDGLGSIYIKAYKQKVFGLNHLLNSDCSNRANQIHYDRFGCLNKCFVEVNIKTGGFYHFNDNGIFNLSEIIKEKQLVKREVNYIEKNLIVKKLDTIDADEGAKKCLKNCPEKGCFWEVIFTLKIIRSHYENFLQKKGKEKIDLNLNTYTAYYSMNDFYLQLFGLFVLFTGTSVLRLLHGLLALTAEKFKAHFENFKNIKNAKLRRALLLAYPLLKYTLTFLSFVFVLIQGLNMINEFRFHSSHPNRTSTLIFSSEPFSLVLCFPVENWAGDETIVEGRNSQILRDKTFKEIEEYTSKLINWKISPIQLFYAGFKLIKSKIEISDEVFFKSSKFEDQRCLSRCFRLEFNLEDERYRKISLTSLWISFNTEYRELFLIEKNQNFTSDLVNFRGLYYPQKATKKLSGKSKKSNCRDYAREDGCGSKRNCLDQCLSKKFIAKHDSIPTNTVVKKSDLPLSWLSKGIYFNETLDIKIENECAAQFNQTDCNQVYFEESPDLTLSETDEEVSIRLSYMNIMEREMEYGLVVTLLDIVSLETIFFGSNALGMLTTALLFFSRIFKLKWYRTYNVILFLLAGAGFLVHNVLVFQSIINGDLNENEFFEKPEWYFLPSPILCFQMEVDVDENRKYTGEYLDNLTKKMTFEQVFFAIRYHNRTHEKDLHIDRINATKSFNFYSSPELELSHLYYPGLKCFKISVKVSYKEEDFFLQTDKAVLKIFLNREFTKSEGNTYFIHQQASSSEISGGFEYKLGKKIWPTYSYYSYDIEFELFRIVRNNQFELLKEPMRLFQEKIEVNNAKSREEMRKRFRNDHNLTTSNPLDRDFDAEVDNDLFDQYSNTLFKQATFKSLNFEQNIANTYTNVFYPQIEFNDPDFKFSFSFLVRRVEITNSENYTKLVVSLLNTLSLWLDICILDMGAWLSQILRLTLHLYCLLIRISNRLDIWRLRFL